MQEEPDTTTTTGGVQETVDTEMDHITMWLKDHIGLSTRGRLTIPRGTIVKQMKQGTQQHLRKPTKGGLQNPQRRRPNRDRVVGHHHRAAHPAGRPPGRVHAVVVAPRAVRRRGRQARLDPRNLEDWLRR